MRTRLIAIIAVLLAGACANLPPGAASGACETKRFAIDADFERGAFAACRIESRRRARLAIRPEDGATNPSPWYAFRIQPKAAGKVVVVLDYGDDEHRYYPKTATGDEWTRLPEKSLRVSKDASEARLSIRVVDRPLFVAAQPLDTIDAAIARIDAPLKAAGFAEETVGASADGRPIRLYRRAPPDARRLVVFLARQHPPETTGAVAFDAFLERLLAGDARARLFFDRHAVLVAPMMNPDGIARGHWRGNAAGADINRDWGPFTTPEAAPVGRAILDLAQNHDPVFFADFHSTKRDVVYAAPEGAGRSPLPDAFLTRFAARLGSSAPEISRSHRSEGTTAKSWSLATLGVAGFTYEVADEANLGVVREQARLAAETLIEAALADEDL